MILVNDWRGIPLFERARAHLACSVDVLVDVGPGIRPQTLIECNMHLCVEPHWEYCDELFRGGYHVLNGAAPRYLRLISGLNVSIDTVVMLDVIEHMTRQEGAAAIDAARALAEKQVVVFTPLGFLEQSGGEERDPWGYMGQRWQEHRSGWTPNDFPGWLHLVDENFAPGHPAFIAIWNAQ